MNLNNFKSSQSSQEQGNDQEAASLMKASLKGFSSSFPTNGTQGGFKSSQNSQDQLNGFYEDDLFLQQLYELQQYELQQIDENEAEQQNMCDSDLEFDNAKANGVSSSGNFFKSMSDTSDKMDKLTETMGSNGEGCMSNNNGVPMQQKRPLRNEEDVIKLISQQNSKKRKLIKSLSNECLELFIESLGNKIFYIE